MSSETDIAGQGGSGLEPTPLNPDSVSLWSSFQDNKSKYDTQNKTGTTFFTQTSSHSKEGSVASSHCDMISGHPGLGSVQNQMNSSQQILLF